MVKLFTKGDELDLEAPIWLDEEYFQKFISFLRENFPEEVKVSYVDEKERIMNAEEGKSPREFGNEELSYLLDPDMGVNQISKKTGRTEVSVKMKKAQFVPEFISWARSKEIDINEKTKEEVKAIISQFIEDRE